MAIPKWNHWLWIHLFYLNAIQQQSFCTFIPCVLRQFITTCVHAHSIHAEVIRSPHENDFNCCRLRNVEKKNVLPSPIHTPCMCAVVVYASVLFPYGYVYFPFCYNNAIDLADFHLLSQFGGNHFWMDFGCNLCGISVNDKKKL